MANKSRPKDAFDNPLFVGDIILIIFKNSENIYSYITKIIGLEKGKENYDGKKDYDYVEVERKHKGWLISNGKHNYIYSIYCIKLNHDN